MRIGVLHPGRMGAAVAAALTPHHEVVWCSAGRSEATARRARDADAREARTLAELVTAVDAVISVCPPAAAEELAHVVIDAGFEGLYLDANAVSPTTATRIADAVHGAGGIAVDGGIVGPPPRKRGSTRLYLSGPEATEVVRWFEGSPLEAVALPGAVGAASALKASYAGWTKATAALLVAVRAHARAAGVEEALLAEWDRSQPGLRRRCEESVPRLLEVAWRFEGELAQIASSMDDEGLPPELHDGAASVYRRLARLAAEGAGPEEALDRLAAAD
jgi:3-hydroxyisobutyrate dehydrogenase-like beta-hydroxyacid dehydrogenase